MLTKYSPAQKAKATAALLSSLALFLAAFAAFVADVLPTGSPTAAAIAGAVAIACAWLVRTATFLTTSAPTLEQIEQHVDEVIDLVKQVRPAAITTTTTHYNVTARDTDDAIIQAQRLGEQRREGR